MEFNGLPTAAPAVTLLRVTETFLANWAELMSTHTDTEPIASLVVYAACINPMSTTVL